MVRRCQSSPEIWAFLRSIYHHEDLITRVTALKKLLLAVLTEQQDISKLLDDWRTLLDNALLSGLLLDDSLQAMFLLAALPTSWRPFITTQALVVGLTVETLIARILQEDAIRDTSAEWLLDTGATHHMTPTSSWLRDYKTLARHVQVYLGNNHCLHAIGLANLHVTLPSGAAIIIRDIYHILDLRRNILSVTATTSSGSDTSGEVSFLLLDEEKKEVGEVMQVLENVFASSRLEQLEELMQPKQELSVKRELI
ncbi:hypothetical protein L7F22_051061 [Adiantum nelumboides]|nr:hypothetical protein [Adiantum nelumboides]